MSCYLDTGLWATCTLPFSKGGGNEQYAFSVASPTLFLLDITQKRMPQAVGDKNLPQAGKKKYG